MKTRKNIYLIIGVLFTVLNIITDIIEMNENPFRTYSTPYTFGYLIGSHILLIFAIILFTMAYRLNKKLGKIEKSHLEQSINNIGIDTLYRD